MIKKEKSFDGITVERESSNVASIIFPLPEDSQTRKLNEGNPESKMMAISMDGRKMGKIYETIGKFVNTALNKELKKIEFLPLNGYPIEDLKKDVENAIKNKRNFCIIENYSDYLEMRNGGSEGTGKNKEDTKFYFNQLHMEYGTSEYSDVALSIMSGKLKELQENLIPKMKKINWI